ncbi:GNAT family N-acetyltransferase [Massilia sp. PAMC28688]|uniref:GNAT family N-acetyltransferase n=1 Tax=Massilia sp. PAMC28688 TaxID=2861283 RepID=UPI001E49AE38|nr:GNAT family N-acetyltransferase [Massilia sp. PAMC28688]
MVPPFRIRTLGCLEWPLYRRSRLRALAEAPHAFGSTLAAEQHRPDALWQARLMAASPATDCPLVAELDGMVVGMVWGKIDAADPFLAHLYQMWVAPEARGRGVGAALIEAVLGWARGNGARVAQLAVSEGNEAAARLYRRAGFVGSGKFESLHAGSAMRSQVMQLALSAVPAQHAPGR